MHINVFPTCNGKVLDLFYFSINNICVSVTISAVVSDHLALVAEIPVSVKKVKNARVVRRIYIYKKADFDGMRSMLSCLNSSNLLNLV